MIIRGGFLVCFASASQALDYYYYPYYLLLLPSATNDHLRSVLLCFICFALLHRSTTTTTTLCFVDHGCPIAVPVLIAPFTHLPVPLAKKPNKTSNQSNNIKVTREHQPLSRSHDASCHGLSRKRDPPLRGMDIPKSVYSLRALPVKDLQVNCFPHLEKQN